ncbi:CS1 type fimbrial major subunit [Yersinia rochesterensis]|uniref:CS1 type fimbrial major subunit n=1 Tax=Yersinia rochesterensis TaxID=1604335 RepID=A0ABM5SRS0_9GAMM|nr:CS1 type fimbrial major subunit [Yersinia rochesterensis]AIN18364.1 CS1 type fimbrial major subunit [Yersinia rochesterensis]AJI88229.1 CS1 type fimbrial major subunit [Yersinia frederiksenii Y225]AJJ37261.1 CS1 type fimbrial major subunit [Yersinia rochesterensis]CRY62370.1 alpha-related fimbriae minor subunit 1 [Yersinia kristensenii]
MMKKTLLSIMTVAILASSTIAHALPFDKDIPVTAEINGSISMTKGNGDPFNNIAMDYDHVSNDGTYEYTENVKIASNTGARVNIKLRNPLVLEGDADGPVKTFNDVVVQLGRTQLNGAGASFALGVHNEINHALTIRAKKPAEALSGETYTGTLQLTIEDDI